MNKELEFAFNGVNMVLEKLVIERDRKDDKAYKTLTNAFCEYMRMFWDASSEARKDVENQQFFINLSNSLLKELEKLQQVLSSSIGSGDYKEHHNWVHSFNKLSSQKRNFGHLMKNDNNAYTSGKSEPVATFHSRQWEEVSSPEKDKNNLDVEYVLKCVNKPFIEELWNESSDFKEYMKWIRTLPQYKGLQFKDSRKLK